MNSITSKRKFSGFSSGTVKATIFILLVGIALTFWLYTQMIFDHVRNYQKSVIKTQVEIYISIIDPKYPDTTGLSTSMFQNVVQESPYDIIFSDKYLNPVQGYWRNVGIDPADTTLKARLKLIDLMKKMDRTNRPEPISMPRLELHIDTLIVYEEPPSRFFPVVVTDSLGVFLYGRNIPSKEDRLKIHSSIEEIDSFSPPERFLTENKPQLIFHGVNYMGNWPMIVAMKKTGQPIYWKGFPTIVRNDTSRTAMDQLKAAAKRLKKEGNWYEIVPIYTVIVDRTWFLHYGDLKFLSLIGWLPIIQFMVILILLYVGFIGFRNITNAEQRSIWVGMAKETAHQLGTPISSIGGWLELLKTEQDPSLLDQAVTEMEYDVKRLTRVAARFSSIGSRPELQPLMLSDVIEEVLDYYRARVPHMGRSVTIEGNYSGNLRIMGNHELLNWAFENLIKNSIASIENRDGRISVTGMMTKDFKHVILDFKDNGKGIPHSDQGKVMKPGFTTKKRGWGLGLSLAQRIINDYHGGRIMLLESKPGAGTIFRVILPTVKEKI
ncbi:MAG: HAMP domain-containing sensor histidine kinase [Candidatus Latescibacter sp.]|nr:HAMP domain-containing sensor histidine kinase [Candidatus Latescibacter sp.]